MWSAPLSLSTVGSLHNPLVNLAGRWMSRFFWLKWSKKYTKDIQQNRGGNIERII